VHNSDRKLAENAAKGDKRAAQMIAERLRDDLFNLFMWLTRDPPLAEDLTQSAFVRLWQALPEFRGESSLRTWAHKIAFSVLAMHNRRLATESRALSEYAGTSASTPSDCVDGQMEMRLAIADALAQLSEAERPAVVLCKLQGFTIAEAARILNRPPGTIAWQIAEGVKKLRALLADWRGERQTVNQKDPIPDQREVQPNVPHRSEPAGSE
jgi:RNA polymerase sigma-70 factor (ECF subfamily)